MSVYGVDIHTRYQAGISFGKLRAEGYSFAVMKFTEGTSVSYLNSAKTWIPQIRAAGMLPGGYHWIKAGDGAAQARYFHNHVKAVGGPKGMLIQLDCEDNATQADVTEWVNEWNRLSGGHPFLIYSGGWWWKPRGWNGTKWTPHLWQSHYLSADADTVSDDVAAFAARIPASWWNPGYGGWSQATILQFTSKGDAGTLGNKVDLNVFRGTLADLRRLAGIAPPSPPAPVQPKSVMSLILKEPAMLTAYVRFSDQPDADDPKQSKSDIFNVYDSGVIRGTKPAEWVHRNPDTPVWWEHTSQADQYRSYDNALREGTGA